MPPSSRLADTGEILERLKRLHPKVIDLSLGRIERLLARLGHPERHLPPVVHIAGTNGKGSTLAMLRSLAEAHGLSVHLYTSPHLVRFNERIVVAGEEIGDRALANLLEDCERANAGEPITFFEITTAAAFLAFAGTPADLTLLETGLGGRLDATNVVAKPKLTVISAISHDHQGYLGETLAEIAFEKAGILKPGVPCCAARQTREVADVICARAAEIGASLAWEGEAWSALPAGSGLVFSDGDRIFHVHGLGLPGAHQVTNAGLAITCAARLLGARLDPRALADGLTRVRWPARLQHLASGALAELLPAEWELWLDGGHNPGAAAVLANHLQQWRDRSTCLVVGMLKTKDIAAFIRPLAPLSARLIGVAIPGEDASLDAKAISCVARDLGLPAEPAASVKDALTILRRTISEPARVLICGSLYLAGTVLKDNQG